MSNIVALKFLQDLRALELEISTFFNFVENSEECPELFAILNPQLRIRVENLVHVITEFILIGEKVSLATGEGENEQVTTGVPMVKELLIEALTSLILRVAVSKSDNLAVTRDLLDALHAERPLPGSKQLLPSLDQTVAQFLDNIGQMKEEFLRKQAETTAAQAKQIKTEAVAATPEKPADTPATKSNA